MIKHGRSTSWVGAFEGRPGSFAVLSHRDGETTGFLNDGEGIYEIRPSPAGDTLLYEVDIEALPPAGSPLSPLLSPPPNAIDNPTLAPVLPESNAATSFNAPAPAMSASGGGVVQDIMLLYTPTVRNYTTPNPPGAEIYS
jgi:hypothetical protein